MPPFVIFLGSIPYSNFDFPFIILNIVSNPTNNTNINLLSLNYGGFLLQHDHNSVKDYYLLDDDGNYMQSCG